MIRRYPPTPGRSTLEWMLPIPRVLPSFLGTLLVAVAGCGGTTTGGRG